MDNKKAITAKIDTAAETLPKADAREIIRPEDPVETYKNDKLFSGEIRMIRHEGTVYFFARDVVAALGWSALHTVRVVTTYCGADALHLAEYTQRLCSIRAKAGYVNINKKVYTIKADALRILVQSAKLPTANDFETWLSRSVVPLNQLHLFRSGKAQKTKPNRDARPVEKAEVTPKAEVVKVSKAETAMPTETKAAQKAKTTPRAEATPKIKADKAAKTEAAKPTKARTVQKALAPHTTEEFEDMLKELLPNSDNEEIQTMAAILAVKKDADDLKGATAKAKLCDTPVTLSEMRENIGLKLNKMEFCNLLRRKGYLLSGIGTIAFPCQSAVEEGLLEIREEKVGNGTVRPEVLVTAKGQKVLTPIVLEASLRAS